MPDATKVYDGATPRESEVLCSTSIISFQQKGKIFRSKKSNYGKQSHVFDSPPFFCNKNKFVILKKDNLGKFYSAISKSIPCNSWSCPDCRIKKAKKLRWKLINVIQLNNLNHLFTLTLDPSKIPNKYLGKVNSTGKYITYLFNWYITNLKRKMRKEIKYVWVKEFQKNGVAHLHIVLNTYLPIKYLRSEWKRIGGGAQMRIEEVKNINAVSIYVSNYITKMSEVTEKFIVGERRYSISHSCLRPPTFSVSKTNFTELQKYLSTDQFFRVYNLLTNLNIPDSEVILAPHQEEIFKNI